MAEAKIRALLNEARNALGASPTPDLDSVLLLSHVTGLGRLQLVLGEGELTAEQERQFRQLVARRRQGTPVAYLVGYKDFYRSRFRCDRRALVPRPETELLVELALAFGDRLAVGMDRPLRVLDLGTGTGCIGLSLALERPGWELTLSDLSLEALSLAEENARDLGLGDRVRFSHSDLFEDCPGPWDLVVSNPPYLSTEETRAVLAQGWGEPRWALDGGPSGTELIERLLDEASLHLAPHGLLLWEGAPHQHPRYRQHAAQLGWDLLGPWADLAGLARVWGLRRRQAQGSKG